MQPETIVADWPAPANVRAFVTTRALGDLKSAGARERLRMLLPAEPAWLRQVHGTQVVDAGAHAAAANASATPEADASFTHAAGVVCCVMAADCMPVLLAARDGRAVAAAHAGWRGLAAGVIERTIQSMQLPAPELLAWLGPAIGPRAYEVGADVREAFLARDPAAAAAFAVSRPGHWLLDLYAVARQRLAAQGVAAVYGGTYCTLSEPARFYSYRRDRATERMAACIYREPPAPRV